MKVLIKDSVANEEICALKFIGMFGGTYAPPCRRWADSAEWGVSIDTGCVARASLRLLAYSGRGTHATHC